MTDLLLAIDQGTSGLKLTIFDLDGKVIADKTKTYETHYPHEGYVEQDCDVWWQVAAEGIKEMIHEKDLDAARIKGIGVDGISWACIPIDAEGNVLYPTMIWLDRRATKEAEWMKEVAGEERLIALSGNPVDAAYITPKMLWLKNNEPEVFAKTYKFLNSNSFIAYRLTGKLSQDHSQGYGFHFYNMATGELDEEMARTLGLSVDYVAPLMDSQEVVGGVTAEVAKLTGLIEGTPVVAGGLDAACCTLGAGVIHVGQTQEQGGQAGGMSICLDQPVIHPKLILGRHVTEGQWLLQGGTTGGGGTLNWFNRELGGLEKSLADDRGISSFEVLSEEASEVIPGSDGLVFLPYMKGERSPLWNEKAKGVYYGVTFDKTRAHMVRSTMEGVAYSLKHNLDTALEVGGKVSKLTSVGGSANSEVWTQLKADITNTPIEVPYSDHATTLGAAILAGVGVGLYADFQEATQRTIQIQRTHEPNPDNKEVYDAGYETYLTLSELMTKHLFQ